MKYIITLEYDHPLGAQRTDVTILGVREIRNTMVRLSQPDLKELLTQQTKENPDMIGKITVVSVASEEPVELPNGDTLMVFAMNLEYNERAAHGDQ